MAKKLVSDSYKKAIRKSEKQSDSESVSEGEKTLMSLDKIPHVRQILSKSGAVPGLFKQRADVQAGRNLVGGILKQFMDYPEMAVDFRPIGNHIETLWPTEAKGASQIGNESPWVERGIDVGKAILDAENALTGRELQAIQTLLTGNEKTGQKALFEKGLDYTTEERHEEADPTPTSRLGSNREARLADQRIVKAKEKMSSKFDSMIPLASSLTDAIDAGIDSFEINEKGERIIPGTNNPFKGVGGPAFIEWIEGPRAADFRQAISSALVNYIYAVSGKAVSDVERRELNKIAGTNWSGNSRQVLNWIESKIGEYKQKADNITSPYKHMKGYGGGPLVEEYYRDAGVDPSNLEKILPQNWSVLREKRDAAKKKANPTPKEAPAAAPSGSLMKSSTRNALKKIKARGTK